jgi:hypothetical protein
MRFSNVAVRNQDSKSCTSSFSFNRRRARIPFAGNGRRACQAELGPIAANVENATTPFAAVATSIDMREHSGLRASPVAR